LSDLDAQQIDSLFFALRKMRDNLSLR
jgi:hypothetical protein